MIKRLMDESKDMIDDEWGSALSWTPFTDAILNGRYPTKFTVLTIPSYGETRDPKHHLYKYSWDMEGCYLI